MHFRDRQDHELSSASDEELLAFIVAARAAGRLDRARVALSVLVYGHWDNLVRRAQLKLPSHQDAEDVAGEALASAVSAAFAGESIGEFVNWMHTILSRRIADFFRRRGTVVPGVLLSEHEGDDEMFGQVPSVEPEGPELLALREAIAAAFARLSAVHQEVVDLYVFAGYGALDTAARIDGMSEDNVHQIASRFRREVRSLLETEGDTGG